MEIKSLIDPEGGLIDRRIFADREIYELERERLFARCWLYLGHECEIPNPGDFVTRYMGEEPVILCRDLNGKLRAHAQYVPPPRQPRLPRRPRQHEIVYLLLSRLVLHRRRQARAGADDRCLQRPRPRKVGIDSGGADRQLQRSDLRHLRS